MRNGSLFQKKTPIIDKNAKTPNNHKKLPYINKNRYLLNGKTELLPFF
jgi:hypothetical protein